MAAGALLAFVLTEAVSAITDFDREIQVKHLRADFTALYEGLKSGHYDLFVHRSKDEYGALYHQILTGFDTPLTLFEAQVQYQKFAAYGNVAHARIAFPEGAYQRYRETGGKIFPIFLRIIEGKAYVAENYSGDDKIKPDDEITAINNQPMHEWLARVAQHISADTPYIAHSLLEFWFSKVLWLELGKAAQFNLTLKRGTDAIEQALVISARTAEEMRLVSQNLNPAFSLDSNAREARMLTEHIAYLRPGPFYNAENPSAVWNKTAFTAFVDQAFTNFLAKRAQTLIIDLRLNPGGDNSFSDHMISWFADRPFRFSSTFRIKSSKEASVSNQKRLDANPDAVTGVSGIFAQKYDEVAYGEVFDFELSKTAPRNGRRFEGDIVALVDRHSFSNAVTVAAIIQDYNFGKVFGEKTSDMATTYGAMEHFLLPLTGIEVGFPKAHIIRPSGDEKTDGVTPDVIFAAPVVPTAEDTVLNNVTRWITAQR